MRLLGMGLRLGLTLGEGSDVALLRMGFRLALTLGEGTDVPLLRMGLRLALTRREGAQMTIGRIRDRHSLHSGLLDVTPVQGWRERCLSVRRGDCSRIRRAPRDTSGYIPNRVCTQRTAARIRD